ncbi:MAG TPA: peptide chain release factor 3, partial [Burkholderiaceae bacterium]|nr:peptide chain release factor 3 [Burkholderiaceae bacterium]
LAAEYNVAARIGPSPYIAARWISADDDAELERFMAQHDTRIARDTVDAPAYLAKMLVELDVARERWPKIRFSAFREFGSSTFASVAAD